MMSAKIMTSRSEERFGRAPFSWRIGVHSRSNSTNKAVAIRFLENISMRQSRRQTINEQKSNWKRYLENEAF